ncbi:MAG: FG-GAP-like repeat-containing protein, partial [Acidobacteriaceae bacterium]
NNGTGGFTEFGTGVSTGTGSQPSDIVAADFNQDGKMDVATSNAGTGTATVLLGTGTGSFTLQTAQPTGTDPIALVTSDINSDGYPDLVAFDELSASTGAVVVLLGNGNGTLQVAQTSAQAFLPGTQATVADFNRDGKPDIALTQQGNLTASVMLNNTLPTQYPDGRSFAAYNPLAIGMGNFADGVAVGDFNRDGNLDIAVSYLQDNDVKVLFGNGGGGFTTGATYAVGSQPFWLVSGDVNGDGYPDLVATNTNVNGATGTVSVLLNNKNGTFAGAATYTVGKQPYQVAIGDVNGDGHPDLAVANYGANTVTILFGSASGTFTVQPTTLTTCANPYGVAIGDFKHNGFPSVAVTCYNSSQLEIFPNNGNGTFGSPYMYTVGNTLSSLVPNPASIALGDFNRDGKLDIVVGNTTANNISFFAGNGDNTFAASVESPSLNFPDSIVAGDFNGDGILDIAGVAPNFNAVELTLGVGDGTFGTLAQRAPGELTAKTQPWALAAGDFNNDGHLDIVTANTYHQVNLNSPAYQTRFLTEYPANPGGYASIDVLMNGSAANISLSTTPNSPIPANTASTTISAYVQPALSGVTPTGSVIFENSAGAPLGSGPYTLNGSGVASYSPGHLGSGSYLYTTLYSGDANFQPTTISGSNATVTVAGTPVTLALNPTSVNFGNTFTATVTVIGNATTGSYPKGTATIYELSGTTAIALGTTGTLTEVGTGNTSTGAVTITANAPNLNVGTYELYAVFNPSTGPYTTGSSGDVMLTVLTPVPKGTATSITCTAGFFGGTCTSTTTVAATGAPVPAGLTVNFTATGGQTGAETTNAAGQATFSYAGTIGDYTITATFPAQAGYAASSNSTTVFCFIICGSERTGSPTGFNSLTPFGETNRATPFRLF